MMDYRIPSRRFLRYLPGKLVRQGQILGVWPASGQYPGKRVFTNKRPAGNGAEAARLQNVSELNEPIVKVPVPIQGNWHCQSAVPPHRS